MGVVYQVDSGFFRSWSKDMAYVFGFIAADGSLEDAAYLRGKYLRVCSSDLEILLKIKSALRSEHYITKIKPKEFVSRGKHYVSKEKYMLRVGNHQLYNDLVEKGITPRKSKTIPFPGVPSEYLPSFARGYLDGDGCIYYDDKKARLSVIFTSGSKEFLRGLSSALHREFLVDEHSVLDGNRAFQLRYSTAEASTLLRRIYAAPLNCLFLSRKYGIYRKYVPAHTTCAG